ncbi:MAG: hypothetical protein FJ398_26275 [Verrucomicrobia bacterium]|nr:hypothetical protein [Verrucomicrobiota bacterium]
MMGACRDHRGFTDPDAPRRHRGRILVAYRRSRFTRKAIAAQAGVGHSTLTLWLRKAQSAENASRTGHSSALVRMPNLFSASAAAPAYRLRLPGGVTVRW